MTFGEYAREEPMVGAGGFTVDLELYPQMEHSDEEFKAGDGLDECEEEEKGSSRRREDGHGKGRVG